MAKALGDHAEGFTYPDIVFRDIPLADGELAVFSYMVLNNGHDPAPTVLSKIVDVTTKVAEVGAVAGGGAVGTAIGALIGSPVPVVGVIVGAAVGYLVGSLLGGLVDLLNPNCDGVVAAAAQDVTALQLRGTIIDKGESSFGAKDIHPGTDSAAGCGANSQYSVTWSIRLTPD
jgi:hypothetical protein